MTISKLVSSPIPILLNMFCNRGNHRRCKIILIQYRHQEQYSTNIDKTYPVQSKWTMYFMHIYTGFAHIAAIAAIENRIMCRLEYIMLLNLPIILSSNSFLFYLLFSFLFLFYSSLFSLILNNQAAYNYNYIIHT